MKLNVRALALTSGILWGLGLFLATLWVILFDGATHEPTLLGRIYRGYNISVVGSLFGLLWGFIDGLIGGGPELILIMSREAQRERMADNRSSIPWRQVVLAKMRARFDKSSHIGPVIHDEGRIRRPAHKRHLFRFGEYFPVERLFPA